LTLFDIRSNLFNYKQFKILALKISCMTKTKESGLASPYVVRQGTFLGVFKFCVGRVRTGLAVPTIKKFGWGQ